MRTSDIGGPAGRRLRRSRLPWLMVAAPALALIVAACSSAAGAPGFTYAPPASPAGSPLTGVGPSPSAQTMSAAPDPSAPASRAPDSTASAAPTVSAAPVATTIPISAQNIQFDTDQLAAPAGQPWVLQFSNNDAGVPHNVEIRDAGGASVFKGKIVTGPTKVSYEVPALPAGTYMFLCDVHPTMTGTLTVA